MSQDDPKRDELAYALITAYSLHKSRTGGILARLLWANVKLVAARMYAPQADMEFVRRYCDAIYDPAERYVPLHYQKLLIQYVLENLARPNALGISNRMMVLVFRGPNAQRDILNAVGHITPDVHGDDVRGTFGDFVTGDWTSPGMREARDRAREGLSWYPALQKIELPERRSSFFEPAVLTGVSREMTEAHLRLFRQHAYSDGGFVLGAIEGVDTSRMQTSMVILKPESFRGRNPLPGNLIDFFARTGMYITAAKVMRLSVEQASEFYALKLPQFRRQLKGMVAEKAREIVEKARGLGRIAAGYLGADPSAAVEPARLVAAVREAEALFARAGPPGPGELKEPVLGELFRILTERLRSLDPPDSFYEGLAEELKDLNARAEFNELIRYMSGADPETGRPIEQDGETICMALLYSGEDALRVIRGRLRELRQVYGQNLLVNRAHASDPDEDPVREMQVLGMPSAPGGEARPCDLEQVVDEFYGPA